MITPGAEYEYLMDTVPHELCWELELLKSIRHSLSTQGVEDGQRGESEGQEVCLDLGKGGQNSKFKIAT